MFLKSKVPFLRLFQETSSRQLAVMKFLPPSAKMHSGIANTWSLASALATRIALQWIPRQCQWFFLRSFSASQSTQRLVSIPCTSACQESCRWGHSLLLWPTRLQWLEMRLPWASRRKSASVVPLFLVSIFGEETSRRYVGQVPSLYTATIDMIQCEAPKISKLVYNSNNYGLWYL